MQPILCGSITRCLIDFQYSVLGRSSVNYPLDCFSKTTLSVVRCDIGKNNTLLSDERVVTDEMFENQKYPF